METGGRKEQPCLETEQGPWPQIPLVPTCRAPDDSHDRDRGFRELPPTSSTLLDSPSGPSSMSRLAPTQPQLTDAEGR